MPDLANDSPSKLRILIEDRSDVQQEEGPGMREQGRQHPIEHLDEYVAKPAAGLSNS